MLPVRAPWLPSRVHPAACTDSPLGARLSPWSPVSGQTMGAPQGSRGALTLPQVPHLRAGTLSVSLSPVSPHKHAFSWRPLPTLNFHLLEICVPLKSRKLRRYNSRSF